MTGIGMVTPLAQSREQSWSQLLSGHQAARQLQLNEIDFFQQLQQIRGLQIAGAPVDHRRVESCLRQQLQQPAAGCNSAHSHLAAVAEFGAAWPTEFWVTEPVVAMTLHALLEAAAHAGLHLPVRQPDRTGCFIGASKGGLRSAETMAEALRAPTDSFDSTEVLTAAIKAASSGSRTPDADSTNPTEVKETHANSTSGRREFDHAQQHDYRSGDPVNKGHLAVHRTDDAEDLLGQLWRHSFPTNAASQAAACLTAAQAVNSCPVAACATGLVSIIQAATAIRLGQCDVCFAGSADAALRSSVLASFHRLRVTSRQHDPRTACRPFDQNRDGFVIGEGAAVLVLESRRHAEKRGAHPIVRVSAGGWLSDPSGITQIDSSGEIVAELLRRTQNSLQRPGSVQPIEYINLHGTGTDSNDLAEANGIYKAFGTAAPVCSAVKGAIGHLLGGAGSVESALTMLALRDGILPCTTNLTSIDPLCPINLVQTSPLRQAVRRAAKLSLGFGGHVACAVFDKEDD